MRFLLPGRGRRGPLAAEEPRKRGQGVETLRWAANRQASPLTNDRLSSIDTMLAFTTPHCVLETIHAAIAAGKNMVVGTTGWYGELASVRKMVEQRGTGFLYGPNFSIGVNLFFDLVRQAPPAIQQQYLAHIYERHHAPKKDAPSGTAAIMQPILQESSSAEIEITSFREGDVVGMHELVLDSPHDTIYLCHDAKSRRGFAEGAMRGADWLAGKKGFFDFMGVWREI